MLSICSCVRDAEFSVVPAVTVAHMELLGSRTLLDTSGSGVSWESCVADGERGVGSARRRGMCGYSRASFLFKFAFLRFVGELSAGRAGGVRCYMARIAAVYAEFMVCVYTLF